MLKPKVIQIMSLIKELTYQEKAQLLGLYLLPPIFLFGGLSIYSIFIYLKPKKNPTEVDKPKTKIKSIQDFF